MGAVTIAVPQGSRWCRLLPSALERSRRSEQALTLAITEMYVQGVSTRKVTAILEQLRGTLSVSSTQISHTASQLDQQLERWRNRPLDAVTYPYLILDARYEQIRRETSIAKFPEW